MFYDMKNSLAFFLKKGNNIKLPEDRSLQCNSDAEQFPRFNSENTDENVTKFLNFLTLVNLKEFLKENESNVKSSKCRRVFRDVPAFMLHILESHNRIDISNVGKEYYGSRINCSKCKVIKVTGHNCTPKEECTNYKSDPRTVKFSEFKKDFGDKNPTLFNLLEKGIEKSTKGEDNCKKSFTGFPRLQAHLVLAHGSVHIGHEDHLNLFMAPPKCKICNSQKLFGLCDCEGKRPRDDGQDGKTDKNAKTAVKKGKKVSESKVVSTSLTDEIVLNSLQNINGSHSEQSKENIDAKEGDDNNNNKRFVPEIDTTDTFYKTWNEQTYLAVTKKSINVCLKCSDIHSFDKECQEGVHQGAIHVAPLSFSFLRTEYESIVHDDRKVFISYGQVKQLIPCPLTIPDVKVQTKHNMTVNCQQIIISSLFGFKVEIPPYVARESLRTFISKQYDVEFVRVKQSFFNPKVLSFTKGMFIADCTLLTNKSFGHLICFNAFKKILYLGDNTFVKVDPNEDHSKLMANLGLSIGHVFLLVKKELVVLDKGTKKKLTQDGLLIDNVANLI